MGYRERASMASRIPAGAQAAALAPAGIVTDAVRCCKLAMLHGVAGQLDGPSSYLMKSPMSQRPDHLAREATERFIAENSRSQAKVAAK